VILPFFLPATLILRFAGPEGAKNPAGEMSSASFQIRFNGGKVRGVDLWDFSRTKRSQLFIRTRNKTLSVAAMCVSNPDRSARLESIAEMHPQLHPALLRLSAIVSQYFNDSDV
jgi:hypothetical protein